MAYSNCSTLNNEKSTSRGFQKQLQDEGSSIRQVTGINRSMSTMGSKKRFTFEELMSGQTQFKSWVREEASDRPSSSTKDKQQGQEDTFNSIKKRWEIGSKSSISSCSSARSSESGEEDQNFGNIMKKFQSFQVRSKPSLVSLNSFNSIKSTLSLQPNSTTTSETSESSVSSRKDMFNQMLKDTRKNDRSRRSNSIKQKMRSNIENSTVQEESEKEHQEVQSSYVKGRLAMFESMR
eukprot:TRINITY_DN705_c0_g1_i1.p1 TRINITY_DN705_c0_g1~~TRINITY_DN705_c0_g1_i1.p1  ORF type:complete len:236 (-),score=14.56 TRINITY_DN705_c0_g1_i1:223-930(-)